MGSVEEFKLGRYFVDFESSCNLSLSSSDPNSLTIQQLLDYEGEASLLTRFKSLKLSYTINQGDVSLRETILEKFYSSYSNLTVENVVVHVGAQEALYTLYHSLLKRGDKVVVQLPNFQTNFSIPKSIGCEIIPIYLKVVQGEVSFDMEGLKTVLTWETQLLILTNPNNPTGFQLSLQEMQCIVNLCIEYDIWLLVDEVYRFDEFDSKLRIPSVVEMYEKGISVSSLSKSLGLPGLKLGWSCSPQLPLVRKINKTKDYLSMTNPATSEFFAQVGLNHFNTILDTNLATMNHNLSLLQGFCIRFSKYFKLVQPKASTVGLLEIKVENFPPGFFDLKLDEEVKLNYGTDFGTLFSIKLSTQAQLFLAPAKFFDLDGSSQFDNFLRVGFGRSNFPLALHRLEEFLIKGLNL